MILGVVEDFSSDVVLDSELTAVSTTGLSFNSGVHPSVTIENLLQFLPFPKITFTDYSASKTYGIYSQSKKREDLVMYDDVVYQSLLANNINHTPSSSPTYWLPTNMESLVLKSFIDKVQDRVYSDLSLSKRLINSQFIYEVGENETTLQGNYSCWVFEPKGSDYVKIILNQICLQAMTTNDVNLYVINQGVLVDTLILHPNNGLLEFEDYDYSFIGKGQWIFAFDSNVTVLSNNGQIDPLKYDSFVCYTATGIGNTPQSATWNKSTTGNGLCFNVSTVLDSDVYIKNNLKNFGVFIRATFELMAMEVFLNNPNNRSNLEQRYQQDRELLLPQTMSLDMNTVAKRYDTELKRCKRIIEKTFDTQLSESDEFEIEITSI